MPITDKSYSTTINDIASGAYATITDSVEHAKNNIITLDKMCNWYLFEDEALIPMPFLNKYKETLLNNSITVSIDPIFYYKPEYVSYNLYGTTDLWYLMLFLNDMKSIEEFNKPRIRVFNPSKLDILKNIVVGESNRYNRDNPKSISKHYIKDPSLPSDKLLPDDDDDILSPGINAIKEIPIESLGFNVKLSDYYFKGKSKMELYRNIDGTLAHTREYHYMDGIRISNSNSNTVYDDEHKGYEYKFTGYINLSKAKGIRPKNLIDEDGEYIGYKFIANGVNGSAYMTINNQPMLNDKGSSQLNFDNTNKQYDYFERETRNSDFKQRNITGWTKKKGIGRVATDKEVKKPVYIVDSILKADGDVIWGVLDNKQLDVSTEPYGSDIGGEIFLKYRFKTKDIDNAKIMPFIETTYGDGTSIREYAFDIEWSKYLNTGKYVDIYLLGNILEKRRFKEAKFGIEIVPTTDAMLISGEFRLDSISVYRINDNMLYNKNLSSQGDWVPFSVVYRHDGSDGPAMFNIMWKEPYSSSFTNIPLDCIATKPDSRDIYNDPASMKECILVTCESGGYNDMTYREILVSKFERRIEIEKDHRKLIYHTNIKVKSDEALSIQNLHKSDAKFIVKINKKEIDYIDEESAISFTPSKYVEGLDDLDLDLIGDIPIILEIVDTEPYEEDTIVQYSVESNISGLLDYTDDERYYINPLTLNTVTQDGNSYDLDMSKNSLIEVNLYGEDGIITNKDQFLLEFNVTIDSPDKGLFIINLDKGEDDRHKYMVVMEYTGETDKDVDEPVYYLRTYAYRTSDVYDTLTMGDIDTGIDFYAEPYNALEMYKNSLPMMHEYNIDNLKLFKGKELRIYVRKNKRTIILSVNDNDRDKRGNLLNEDTIVGSWIDDDWESYLGGVNTLQFLNIRHATINSVKFSM